MEIKDLKENGTYYIRAKYLRAFERYFGKTQDVEQLVEVTLIQKPFDRGYYSAKFLCSAFKNPVSDGGYWYIEGNNLKYLTEKKEYEENTEFTYYLKISYLNDKYGKNKSRILKLENGDGIKAARLCRSVPAFLAIESKSNSDGFEIVTVHNMLRVPSKSTLPSATSKIVEDYLLDSEFNSYLGILNRRVVDPQFVYKAYTNLQSKENTFDQKEYDKLLQKEIEDKNEITQLKIELDKLKTIIKVKTEVYIKLLTNYNKVNCKLKELEKDKPSYVLPDITPQPVDPVLVETLKENAELKDAVIRLTLELNAYKK